MSSGLQVNLSGARALVTGGTQGIGKATVEALIRSGANVVTSARSGTDSDSFIMGGSFHATGSEDCF